MTTPNVVIQPCADKAARAHFADTIQAPVPMARITPYVSDGDVEVLQRLYGTSAVPMWGATAGKNDTNVSQWNKIREGDLVLFMGDHHVFASGDVTHKLRSPELARSLWSLKDGQPFEYVFFLRNIQSRNVH